MEELDEIEVREAHIKTVGYVRSDQSLVGAILPYCPIVEINAGTGALAAAIAAAGGRIVATDAYLSHGSGNWWGRHHRVFKAEATRVGRLLRKSSLSLLSSWPNYDEHYCYETVRQLPIGSHFLYIGEGEGGCTGDDALHELLREDFELLREVPIDAFEYMHDQLWIYKRSKADDFD